MITCICEVWKWGAGDTGEMTVTIRLGGDERVLGPNPKVSRKPLPEQSKGYDFTPGIATGSQD